LIAPLREAGKPRKFVRLDGEDHWLSRSTTRARVLAEVKQSLAANLKPAAP
jgi:dipeptidyl aminopeptidase/acylaminoacyl peptidase